MFVTHFDYRKKKCNSTTINVNDTDHQLSESAYDSVGIYLGGCLFRIPKMINITVLFK
jgi:hypothetical protein